MCSAGGVGFGLGGGVGGGQGGDGRRGGDGGVLGGGDGGEGFAGGGDGVLLGGSGGAAAGELAHQVNFALAVGCVVGAEDVVEPDGGLELDVGALPGVPGEVGLGLAEDEAPVDGGDVVLFRDGEDGVEGAAGAAGHVLGAEDGAVEGLEGLDAGIEELGPVVVVEGDDVGLGELDLCGGGLLNGVGPVALPDAGGEGLGGVGGAGPGEGMGEEHVDAGDLGGGVDELVAALVVGLVPDVPGEDAVVVGEGGDDALDVLFELGLDGADPCRRSLAGGLCTQPELCTPGMGGCCGPRCGLGSQQESKSTSMRLDVVLRWAMSEELVKALFEALRGPASQSWSCRKTRMVFMPMDSPRPSSRSLVARD